MRHHASLLTLAFIAAPALAQSTKVTLSGLIDVYVARSTATPGGVNATSQRTARVDNGGMTTSHVDMIGSEDLGDGLSAGFELSSFIRADSGQVGRSDAVGSVAADPFWAREASISLSHRTYGRIRLGNFSTPMFSQSLGTNAFLASTTFSPINIITFIGSPLTGGTGWTNQVGYDSPDWGGFSVSASVSASEGRNGRNSGARAEYAQGPWAVSLAWQSVKKDPLTFADGTSPNNTKAWQLAGSYDFKTIKVYAHAGAIQNDGNEGAPLDVKYRIWDISATLPMGRGHVLLAYANRRTTDAVGAIPPTAIGGNKKREVYSVAYDYFVSKRTDLYAVMMHDKTLTNTLPAPGKLVRASATDYGVGIRHSF